MNAQVTAITNYLLAGEKLTQLQALKLFGCGRLAARILEIKKVHDVRSRMVPVTKADGSTARVAEYYLHRSAGPLFG